MSERPTPAREAAALAICRIAVFGLLALDVWAIGDPARLADLPREWWVAQGPLRWLPDALHGWLFEPATLRALRATALMCAIAATAGVRPFAAFATSFCVIHLLLRAIAAGFVGFVGHGWLAITLCAWVLAAFPADAALVPGRARRPLDRVELYTAPIVAMGVLLCTSYFLLGVRRFARGGLEIFVGDALPTYIGLASLKEGAHAGFEAGLVILTSSVAAAAMKAGYFAVTVMEVLAPVCIFSARFRWPWLAVMIPFHVSTLFTMNVFFENNLVLMLLLLTPLPFWLGARLARD